MHSLDLVETTTYLPSHLSEHGILMAIEISDLLDSSRGELRDLELLEEPLEMAVNVSGLL